MAKVLITGGAGFIGGFLARHLAERGDTVHIVDNFARGPRDAFLTDLIAGGRTTLIERDLATDGLGADLGDDYDVLYHLAALLGVSNVRERPYATLRDNVRLLESALDFAARQRRLARFVFASTSEVYAGSFHVLPIPIPTPENVPLALAPLEEPRTSYALSKIYGEAMVRHSGVPFTIVRPHNVYGPRMGMAHVIPELLAKAHRAPDGGTLDVFSVDHRRTFCFVDDAVEMIARAASAPAGAGTVLNIGNAGPEITMRELATVIIRTVGKPLTIASQPAQPGSPARRCPDVTQVLALTGVRDTVALEDGVRRTYDWYRTRVFA